MPVTRSTNRSQKRKRNVAVPISVDSDLDSDQSSADSRTIQSSPGLLPDFRTKKKAKPNPQHALPPTVDITSAEGQAREDMPVATTQLKEGDWLGLTDNILQELKETLGPSGGDLPIATKTFLCEVLSAILLRFHRAYSLEKLFGQGNSGPKGAVKDAIEQDNLEISFERINEFAADHGYRPIKTVKGNRASRPERDILTGTQLFDLIWGSSRHRIPRTHWDRAVFRQQYHRIRDELDIPGPAREMRQKLDETLECRFLQSQTVFSYPDPNNGAFASTAKLEYGERPRMVWYHQTPVANGEGPRQWVQKVKRCNIDPRLEGEDCKPMRLPETFQLWELVISHCRKHGLHFTSD